jgi:integrase
MKKPILIVRPYRHRPPYKFVVDLRGFGKGRKFFKTRQEADAETMRQKTLLERHSREAVGLSPRQMSDIITAREKLAKYGETILDAVQFRVDHLERVRRHGITVGQLASEVIEAKNRDGRSEVYLRDLRYRLNKFVEDFGQRPIAGMTVDELDNWLRALPFSPQSRTNYRTVIGLLFSYAESRGIIERNPISRTAKPKLVNGSPEIFSVDELRALLESANTHALDVLPMLAIGAFAGLREAEIQRLDWSEVDFSRSHIEVKAAKAKSARRRIVPIQRNLAAWLQPYSGMTGAVVPKGARRKLSRVREAAKLARWPNNGLRHSFASYRFAACQDAPRVAAELGHTSPQMLFSTYRELVRPEEAERYWQIMPLAEVANVLAFNATA